MHHIRTTNDAAMWHMHELSARVVAGSGLAHDRYHMGKLILQGLKDAPDFVLQIDGGTGKSETCGSVLDRSVKCANAMRALGLQCGDVIILMAPNHLDLCIPYYAALYLGVIIAPIDRMLKIKELQQVFEVDEPKIVFCQSEKANDVKLALNESNQSEAKIVTFDENLVKVDNVIAFDELLNKHGNGSTVEEFKAADFDPADTTALLVSTSGTTGLSKQSMATHKNLVITGYTCWSRYTQFPTPIRMSIVMSPLQWMSAILHFNNSPLLRFTRLQSSSNLDPQHCCDLINNYKPEFMIISPTLLTTLFKPDDPKRCDLSCFTSIVVGGSAVSTDMITKMKELDLMETTVFFGITLDAKLQWGPHIDKLSKRLSSAAYANVYPVTEVFNGYGLSEASMTVLNWDRQASGSSGKPSTINQYRLVDVENNEDIVEPNKTGELWLKGPNLFKGYYKNPVATADALTDDGWFKTGDLLYRDEHWNFYFVERLKLLLKYMNHQISPVEIEQVIRQHPGVQDVAVTGIPDKECGELPVACVVRKKGAQVFAKEIKDLVKESLTDTKQLRGGVIFLDEMPVLPTTKVNYRKLKEMAIQINRE